MGFRTKVIVNPMSANGRTQKRWPDYKAAFDRVLDVWDDEFTAEPRAATGLARAAVEAGYDMVVCVGGDGTMSEVVTGLFQADPAAGIAEALVRPGVVLGAVRAGTGGDFARLLGLSHELPAAVAHLEGDETEPCDLGLLDYTTFEGGRARTAFLNIASFGLSGVVDEKVNGSSKVLGGRMSFLMGLGKAVLSYKPTPVRIEVDGEEMYEGPINTVAVANGQYFGGGMRYARDARTDDGRFEVVVQTPPGFGEYFKIGDLYSGKLQDWASVRHRQGQVVTATPEDPAARVVLDVDGEPLGQLPATFRVIPGAVRLKR